MRLLAQLAHISIVGEEYKSSLCMDDVQVGIMDPGSGLPLLMKGRKYMGCIQGMSLIYINPGLDIQFYPHTGNEC